MVPVVPGRYDVARDKTGDPCAACGQAGDYRGKRILCNVNGLWLMLCIDYLACKRRITRGLTWRGYLEMEKQG